MKTEEKQKPYIVMKKTHYFSGLIFGLIIIFIGVFYINSSSGIGFGMLGFGFAIVLLLLEQKLNSIGLTR